MHTVNNAPTMCLMMRCADSGWTEPFRREKEKQLGEIGVVLMHHLSLAQRAQRSAPGRSEMFESKLWYQQVSTKRPLTHHLQPNSHWLQRLLWSVLVAIGRRLVCISGHVGSALGQAAALLSVTLSSPERFLAASSFFRT